MRSNSVRIADFSDREILAMMMDISADGIVMAGDLTLRAFGLKADDDQDVLDHAARCVTSRLAWMRRFGLVEKGDEVGEWSVSREGRIFREAKLGRAMSSAITNTQDGSMLVMAHEVGERFLRAKPIAQTAMRRELQFQIGRRKR
jgi:hypothetical protein